MASLADLPSPSIPRANLSGLNNLPFPDPWKNALAYTSAYSSSMYPGHGLPTSTGIGYYPPFSPAAYVPFSSAYLPPAMGYPIDSGDERGEEAGHDGDHSSSITSLRIRAKEHMEALGK